MPFAVTLSLDPASATPVGDLIALLAAKGLVDMAQLPAVGPNVTLAVYPDSADPVALRATTAALSVQWKPLTVRFAGLGMFIGPPGVLWLAPVATSSLLVRHAQLLARHPAGGVYASGAWVPHVTLSQELADPAALGAAAAAVAASFAPFDAVLNRVELVQFAPAQVLFSGALGEG